MFKLLELELKGHKVLKGIKLNFADESELNKGPYSTVIIGPNGTGKSNLLRTITDIFREIENIAMGEEPQKQKLAGCSYRIKYILNEDIYEYTNTKKDLVFTVNNIKTQCLKNGNSILPQELKLPSSIITSSIMLNDRFYVPKDYKGKIYNYLGARRITTPSVGGTQTYTRRIVELLLQRSRNIEFKEKLLKVMKQIGYGDELILKFYPRYRTRLFTGNLTSEFLYDYYIKWETVLTDRKYAPYGYSYFVKRFKDNKPDLDKLTSFINVLAKENKLNIKGKYLEISLFKSNLIGAYSDEIIELGKLDLLSDYDFGFPIENIDKKNKIVYSDEISSGEYHIFASFVGIISLLKEDSIILLDEPDLSLHPNWQMLYVNFLKKVFDSFKGCHFIFATHSHFMISDLEPSTSHLIGFKKNVGITETVELPKSTYGWSAENILYNVFEVRTNRNYYFEDNLKEMLSLISQKSKDYSKISALQNKVQKYLLNEKDPLHILLEQVGEYIANANQ